MGRHLESTAVDDTACWALTSLAHRLTQSNLQSCSSTHGKYPCRCSLLHFVLCFYCTFSICLRTQTPATVLQLPGVFGTVPRCAGW